jgi:2',3'-cyclic-nucleotide 2'-phosphodiesterase (5'-nucleotidase family)
MLRQFFTVIAVFFILLLLPWPGSGEQITILHTNDTHSHMYSFGPLNNYGGIARMSALIKKMKRKNENVLTLHAGDVFVGTFAFNKYLGYAELDIMEELYDAMVLGNHEFDLGIDTLAGIFSGQIAGEDPIALPFLLANIDWEKVGEGHPLQSFVQPHRVVNIGGVKVGLLGVVTTDPYNYSEEVNAILTDPYQAAWVSAGYLRAVEAVDLVVAVSHLGKMADVAGLSQIPGIDIIVGGHSHDALFEPLIVNGTIIVQAGEYGKYLGELKVNVENRKVELVDYTLHQITRRTKIDYTLIPELFKIRLGIFKDPRFGPVYTKPIARAIWNLEEKWEEEDPNRDTPLGNLVVDAIKAGVQENGYPVDIVLEANGYIAHRIYKGKVVGNDILRSVPYGYDAKSGLGFKIKSVLLVGAQILAGLEYTVSLVEYTDELAMQASGLTFEYDSSKPPAPLGEFSRLDLTSVRVNGNPINPDGMYWVAMNEQLVSLLGSLGLEPFAVEETGLFEYNLVRDFMRQLRFLAYTSEGRIIDTAFED